jgi:tRNA nucleotidyltransferase (CCA-adding enzyme)
MPVKKVADRMQRYGYEGYPVVENGVVVGLITRRAVDRALNHKLNLSAAELMMAGEVTIHPNDSLETLQRLMTDTGWGQVPVVNPEKGDIIGIVTRTDLLKTFTSVPELNGHQNLAARLEACLPPARVALLKTVAEAARAQRAAFYIVGGFVRDLLLERPSLDYDLVVEGDAIALARSLSDKFGGRVTTHKRFGTAKWRIAQVRETLARQFSQDIGGALDPGDLPETLDLVSARREFYKHPTALPTVERGSIKLDLHRRDFTINTLALRLDGRHYGDLHDYWGGLNDLHNGIIRVLHSLSFVDDPTRILRAVRFEQRFSFQIENRTLELLRAALPLLDRVSGDRIRHELDAILEETHSLAMLTRLNELGILEAIHTDLYWDEALYTQLQTISDKDPGPEWKLGAQLGRHSLRQALSYIIWLVQLPSGHSSLVSKRLKLTRPLHEAITASMSLLADLPTLKNAAPSKVVARLENLSPLALYGTYLVAPDEETARPLYNFVTRWRDVKPVISGHALRERGLPPGPTYKRILGALRAAWLDGEVATGEEEAALLEKLLNE